MLELVLRVAGNVAIASHGAWGLRRLVVDGGVSGEVFRCRGVAVKRRWWGTECATPGAIVLWYVNN